MEDNAVKKFRIRLNLSQERFARLVGVSLQTVRRWEAGTTRPLPIINDRIEEIRRQMENAQKGERGEPMSAEDRKTREVNLGGLFKGLGSLFDLASRMVEEEKEEYNRSGELDLGGKAKGVYGFSVKLGLGGKPVIEQFGNIKTTDRGPIVEEVREPLVDVLDEEGQVVVIAEIPGVEEKDVRVSVREDILEFTAESGDRKYSKELLLPHAVDADSMQSSSRNGIVEIRLAKKR